MRLLDRYLLRELLAPLAYCFVGIQAFVIVFTVFTDLQKLQDSKLHFVDTVEYAFAASADFLPIVMPLSLLLGLLVTLTYHARHNEITAMRAAGMSLWRICTPYFMVGIFASVLLFALNELIVPRGEDFADKILNRYIKQSDIVAGQKEMLGFQNDRARRTWFFEKFNFGAQKLTDVTVVDLNGGLKLNASYAVRTNGVWTFFNVREDVRPQPGEPFAPLLQTNVLAMPEFSEEPREMRIELRIAQYESEKSRKKMVPLRDIFDYLRLRSGVESAWLQTQLHQHFAAPLTCIVVVLIAIPFGAASGRRNLFFGVAGSIFICFAYFTIQQISFALGIGGHLPGWLAAWLPNFIFGATGIFLTMRVR